MRGVKESVMNIYTKKRRISKWKYVINVKKN